MASETYYRAADTDWSGEGIFYATDREHAETYLGGCDGDGGEFLYAVKLHAAARVLDMAHGSYIRSAEALQDAIGEDVDAETDFCMEEIIEIHWESIIMANFTHVLFDDVAGCSCVKLDDATDSLSRIQ